MFMFFFFKQKTAYEMRISDWSSDVCSSDLAALLRPLIPSLDAWRFSHHIVGLSMYTPDGKLLLGPIPAVEDLLVAGGCCGSGIAMSGGIGFALAELIADRNPTIDRAIFDPTRFGYVDPAATGFRELFAAPSAGARNSGWGGK